MGITAIPPARLESWGSCAKQSKEIARQIKEEINKSYSTINALMPQQILKINNVSKGSGDDESQAEVIFGI